MEKHINNRLHSLMVGLASAMSSVFLFSPPFEKNPQQCEMVQTIGRKKTAGGMLSDEEAT